MNLVTEWKKLTDLFIWILYFTDIHATEQNS